MIIRWKEKDGSDNFGTRLAYFSHYGVRYMVVYSDVERDYLVLNETQYTTDPHKGPKPGYRTGKYHI